MWLEIFMVLHLIVFPNSISCQPVTDSIREIRQTNFEQCCPCSSDDGTDFREPDMSPNSPMGSFTQEADDCPCRLSGIDSQGSPSIFRPFILRNSHPSEREQHTKQKPLLQPEVGLASSVLETIQKATDEEYKEALEREASRTLVEIEPSFHDSEAGNSRNSVTIVLNPREDLYDDAMPEASHVHETRCIHSPLGRSSVPSNDMVPRMSKQHLFLKGKPVGHLTKSLFDMDNGASNLQETFAVNNDLNNKLRMNPLLLNNLPIKSGENINNHPISKVNSMLELRTTPAYIKDFKNNELNDSPKHRLAALKSRLRDLVEMRNIKRLHNTPDPLKQNNLDIFSNKVDSNAKLAFVTNSPLDPIFDNASPVLKNILKLKDVELLPPRELLNKHLTEEKSKLSDLNVAGTENDVIISDDIEGKSEKNIKFVTRKISESEENVLNDRIESKESRTEVLVDNSDEIQASLEKENSLENSKDVLIKEMQRRLDDCLKSARRAQDDINKNDQTETDDSFEYDSKETDDKCEMEDAVAETSDIINEKISQEEVNNNTDKEDSSNSHQTAGENKNAHDSLLVQENNGLTIFRNDILRKLDNIKKSIKSKLQDTDTITKPIIFQPINEKSSINQDLNDSDLSSEGDQNMAVTPTQPTNEKYITNQDLQNLSNSLLHQENRLKATTPSQGTEDETIFQENENNDFEPSVDSTNDDSVSSEIDPANAELDENQASSEDDTIGNESSLDEKQENSDSQTSKHTCDTDECDVKLDSDNTHPEDSETNEMSSQASNSKYNTIIPPLNDNLRGPSLLDTFSLFKTPLQIPSLEEIKQGITDIIDAGQKEEDFQTDFDPINESSNRNSVLSNPLQSNFPKLNYLGQSLTDRYLRPLQNTRNNIGGYENILDTASLITESIANPSTLRYPLASNRLYPSGNKLLKASADPTRTPSLDITRFFDSQSLPKTNLLKSPTFNTKNTNTLADDLKYRLDLIRPDFKQASNGNQLLGRPRLEKDDFLQSMSRKHEDMKEKLQALHLDFNDRLASVYKRLNDQKNIQSVNIPNFKAKENRLALPKTTPNKEIIGQNSKSLAKLDNIFFSQPKLLPDEMKKSTPKSNSVSLKVPLRKNNFNKPKASTTPLIERENINKKYPNLSEKYKLNMNKQKYFTPISKVKISFTTPKPLTSELQKSKDPIRIPTRFSEKERTADLNSNLKDISKSLRSRFQSLSDLNHAPSEIIERKTLNKGLMNPKYNAMSITQPRIDSNQDSDIVHNLKDTQQATEPKKIESPLLSLREALKTRLKNINTYPKASKNPVESTNLKVNDAMVSPSNVKTSVLSNPLIENTSYKCTMVCSKDQ